MTSPAGGGAGVAAALMAYDAVMSLLVPIVLTPFERLQVILGRSTRKNLNERLGRWRSPPGAGCGRPLLVHAVSAGEVAAAARLIEEITARDPELRIVLSTGNREGWTAAEILKRRVPAVVAIGLLPWDRRRSLRVWLAAIDPCAVVVVETEIWPGLFRAAESLGIPLLVVNGRINVGDVRRYRLALPVFRKVLEACIWIGVQNNEAREAFLSIGASSDRVVVAGDLKLGRTSGETELGSPWRAALDQVHHTARLVVAGSTHYPEELWLVDTLRRLRENHPETRMILAPRHPHRAKKILRSAGQAGLRCALWSTGPSTDWEVLIVDSLGQLAALYQWADVAVIGGSIAKGGGHNPIEAAAAGRPVLIGHAHDHVCDVVHGLEQAGGIKVLSAGGDPQENLHRALTELLGNRDLRLVIGEKAAAYCLSQRGAACEYAEAVLSRSVSSDHASTGTARDTA